jgi:tetratricopeptide (TPR) repeat protein
MNLSDVTLHIARSLKDASSKASTLENVVATLQKSGDPKHAEQILQDALQEARAITNTNDADAAFGMIALGLTKGGNIAKAWQIVQMIRDVSNKDSTLWDLVQTLTEAGDYGRAAEFARAMQNQTPYKALAFEHIALTLAEKEQFQKALDMAHAIPDERRKTMTIIKIATALAETGDARQAIKIANALPNQKERTLLLIDIAGVLSEAGDVDTAITVAASIQDPHLRNCAFLDISTNATALNLDDTRQIELAQKIMSAFQR